MVIGGKLRFKGEKNKNNKKRNIDNEINTTTTRINC